MSHGSTVHSQWVRSRRASWLRRVRVCSPFNRDVLRGRDVQRLGGYEMMGESAPIGRLCMTKSLCVRWLRECRCSRWCPLVWWVCGAGGNACVERGGGGMHACAHVCRGAVHVFVVELLLFSCRFSYAISTLTSSTPLRARQVGCAVSWSAPVRLFYVLEDRRRSPLVHAGNSMLNVVCVFIS